MSSNISGSPSHRIFLERFAGQKDRIRQSTDGGEELYRLLLVVLSSIWTWWHFPQKWSYAQLQYLLHWIKDIFTYWSIQLLKVRMHLWIRRKIFAQFSQETPSLLNKSDLNGTGVLGVTFEERSESTGKKKGSDECTPWKTYSSI